MFVDVCMTRSLALRPFFPSLAEIKRGPGWIWCPRRENRIAKNIYFSYCEFGVA